MKPEIVLPGFVGQDLAGVLPCDDEAPVGGLVRPASGVVDVAVTDHRAWAGQTITPGGGQEMWFVWQGPGAGGLLRGNLVSPEQAEGGFAPGVFR
ncbi:MAG: hypothetical protein CMM29_00045 [Rhodospirillaceae bacterium]|nr:hypothetical protein [Rhodospirillaceae bacterium]